MPYLLYMCSRFHAEANLPVPLDLQSVERTLFNFLATPICGVWIAERERPVGMLAAIIMPVWFNSNLTEASELIWWAEPGCGGGLWEAMEQWAQEKGAAVVQMGAMDAMRPDTLARLYRRKGYEPKERYFVKRLN